MNVPNSKTDEIVSVKNICFTYPHANRTALDNVSFSVHSGEYIALVGANGSGKSTLLRLLAGFLQSYDGSVIWNNDSVKRETGIVFQEPKMQIVSSVAERDTAFGPQNLGLSKDEIELRTIESLSLVSLLDRAFFRTTELSLGQLQRLAFCGIYALFPKVLLLDEVTAMLDEKARQELLFVIQHLNKTGHTILHITHNNEEVALAKRVIALEKGKIIFDGSTEQFFHADSLKEKMMGLPVSVLLKNKSQTKQKEIALKVEKLSFSYASLDVFKHISFSLPKGSLTALVGPSGCGKSTLFECLAGLKNPQEGKILSTSRPLLALQESERALFAPYAADDVAFGPQKHGINGKPLLACVKKAMNEVGLPYEDFADRQTFYLSGGEKRKLSIAGIIALEGDVFIFDEPTSALDPTSRNTILAVLQNLAASGKTVLFSTHRKDEACIADSLLLWEDITKSSQEQSLETKPLEKDVYEEKNLILQRPLKNGGLLETLENVSASLSSAPKIPDSPLKRLSAPIKFFLFLVLFMLPLLSPHLYGCVVSFCLSILYAKLSKFPLKKQIPLYVRILPLVLFFVLVQFVFYTNQSDTSLVLFESTFLVITVGKIFMMLKLLLSFFCILITLGTFLFCTQEKEILDALAFVLRPLSFLHIPVRYAIIVVGIMFRFMPLLLDELSGILKTQMVRAQFGNAKGVAKFKMLLSLFVPLCLQTFRKAQNLADALTARKCNYAG